MQRLLFPLPLALVLDELAGDPPNAYHPVAWMGSLIAWLKRRAPSGNETLRFLYGGGIVLGGGGLIFLTASAWQALCKRLPAPLGWLLEAAALKMVIGGSSLARAGDEVYQALAQADLPAARRLVSWHLVSRDTRNLNASQVSAATIESIGENFSDGVVAPAFFYALGGLPAAYVYRFCNTCDSMLGYHDPLHEWLGKIPARIDDLLNLVPARLSAGLLLAANALRGGDTPAAMAIWRRDCRVTQSPNAGHPMSAMAGCLQVELEKVGHYQLGAGCRPPQPADIPRATRLMRTALVLGAGLGLLAGFCAWRRGRHA